MTNEIEARRAFRTRLMNWVFDQAGGSPSRMVSPQKFLADEGLSERIDRQHLDDAIDYLEREGLIRAHRSLGGVNNVQLDHGGIVEIEQARTQPSQPTEHFVPMVNITTIHGNVVGSQLQQGSPGASQTGEFTVNQREQVRNFIESAREAAKMPQLESEDRQKIITDLDFMEAELQRAEPRWDRLKGVGSGVRSIIMSGLSGALGRAITELPWHDAINAFPG